MVDERVIMREKTSKYFGVRLDKSSSGRNLYWRAEMVMKGKRYNLGTFPYTDEGEKQAAIAYDKFRLKNGMPAYNFNFKRVE